MLTLRAVFLALLLAASAHAPSIVPSAHAQSTAAHAQPTSTAAHAKSILSDADTSAARVVVDIENDTRIPLRDVPGRGLPDALGLLPGVDRHEGTDSLTFSAIGGDRVAYYLNGVPVRTRLPWKAVSSVEVYTGHVPASLGDALTGVVSVTTSPRPSHIIAGGGLYSSIGAEGNRLATAHVAAPLLSKRLHVQAFGEVEGWADHHPRALVGSQLRGGLLEQVTNHPQVVSETNEITPTPYTLTENDFESARHRAGSDLRRHSVFGDLSWHQNGWLSLSVAARHAASIREDLPFAYSLFQETPFSRTEGSESGLQAVVEVRPRSNASFRVMGDYSDIRSVTHHPAFSSSVADVIFYGDIDHAANAAATRYVRYDPFEGDFDPSYEDGSFPHAFEVMNVFAPSGSALTGYEKSRTSQLHLAADGSIALKGHDVMLGVSFERQTRRLYRIANPYFLARYYDDGNVEAGSEAAKSAFQDLSQSELYRSVYYYGYDLHAVEEVASDDVTAYFLYPQTSSDLAPFRPQRYSAYVQDRASFGPVRLDIGLRLDAFDNNTRVLRDPYAYFPIARAGDLSQRPEGIGADFAVYYDHADGVVGYRDLEGQFYDAQGAEATAAEIDQAGSPRVTIWSIAPETFRDNGIDVVVQPRVRADVSIFPGTTVFASYDHFARRPLERSHVPLLEYQLATEGVRIMNNASLKPERSTLYSLGIRQRAGELLAGARVFQRSYDDVVGLVPQLHTFPNDVYLFSNIHDAKVKGLEISLSMQKHRGLWGLAGYVLQRADGTAIEASEYRWTLDQVGNLVFPDARPLDLDRRHQIKLVAGYHVERGPRLAGIQPLEGLDVAIFADLKSGRPYSTYDYLLPIWSQGALAATSINGERMPWTYLLNVKVTKSFAVGSTSVAAFVWIDNVLNRRNVVDVYSATGSPDDDGFLDTSVGQDVLSAWGELADIFSMYYNYRLADPDHFGIPRMIRIGIDVTL